jgi:hypothetical protein
MVVLIGATMWNGWSMDAWAETERADPSIETASAEAATFARLYGEAHLKRIIEWYRHVAGSSRETTG